MTLDLPSSSDSGRTSRRSFLKTVSAGALVTSAPAFLGATDKAGAKNAIIGEGAHKYECLHNWGELPSHIQWGETHGVAVDEAGLIYIKHRSHAPEPMDAVAIFDPAGKFVRSFGKEYHGGGHGIDIRKEGNEEFLYLCDVKHNIVVKTNLLGEVVWRKEKPQEPGVYLEGMKYSPTNIAFAPDGGFYIADGYGSHFIHQYDKDAKWVRAWGGSGKEPGKMATPHGIWLDNRPGRPVELVVADRANARLQYFTTSGEFLRIVEGVSFPAHFDIRGEELLIPDLHARVTIMDKENNVITHLGYDPEWTKEVLGTKEKPFAVRKDASRFVNGRFVHPHDACYDKDGNIFVVEWVTMGRVTKLVRLA
ncbi:MAG: peptidase [Planctomycetales bacterium]